MPLAVKYILPSTGFTSISSMPLKKVPPNDAAKAFVLFLSVIVVFGTTTQTPAVALGSLFNKPLSNFKTYNVPADKFPFVLATNLNTLPVPSSSPVYPVKLSFLKHAFSWLILPKAQSF